MIISGAADVAPKHFQSDVMFYQYEMSSVGSTKDSRQTNNMRQKV